jgi:hypothetical protein
MIFLVKMASQGGGGKDWGWWREPLWRMWELRPVSPWVNRRAHISNAFDFGGVVMIWTTSATGRGSKRLKSSLGNRKW